MAQVFDHKDRVTFKDVLLARRYLLELRDTGKLSPDLQAAVDQRGAEHVERLAQIIAQRNVARACVEQRAHGFAERVVAVLKAKRELADTVRDAQTDPDQCTQSGET